MGKIKANGVGKIRHLLTQLMCLFCYVMYTAEVGLGVCRRLEKFTRTRSAGDMCTILLSSLNFSEKINKEQSIQSMLGSNNGIANGHHAKASCEKMGKTSKTGKTVKILVNEAELKTPIYSCSLLPCNTFTSLTTWKGRDL